MVPGSEKPGVPSDSDLVETWRPMGLLRSGMKHQHDGSEFVSSVAEAKLLLSNVEDIQLISITNIILCNCLYVHIFIYVCKSIM